MKTSTEPAWQDRFDSRRLAGDAADTETVRKIQREASAGFDRVWAVEVVEQGARANALRRAATVP